MRRMVKSGIKFTLTSTCRDGATVTVNAPLVDYLCSFDDTYAESCYQDGFVIAER